jgi:hypothetical protein
MSLTVNQLGPATGTDISLASGHRLQHEGKVVQTVYTRSDSRPVYTAFNSGDGTAITQLRLTITPTRSDSWIWLRWTIFYEVHHDTVFLVQQNGSLIGFNTQRGNARWSGILTPLYDNDYSTTPQNSTINWFVRAGSTASRFYDLAIRSSQGSNFTFVLNRCLNSAGTDGQEVGVSFGFAREIGG